MMNLSTTVLCVSWAIALAVAGQSTAAYAEGPAVAEAGSVAKSDVLMTSAGRTSSGVPLADISLNSGVSVEGLDLNSTSGAAELEKRVNDAAQAACRQISLRYPNAGTSDADCVKAAVDKAMVKVRELVAEAHKRHLATR